MGANRLISFKYHKGTNQTCNQFQISTYTPADRLVDKIEYLMFWIIFTFNVGQLSKIF
jgi:hypothetical protein